MKTIRMDFAEGSPTRRRDQPRDEHRVMVEVEAFATNGASLGPGVRLKDDQPTRAELYLSDAERLVSHVRTKADARLVRQAEEISDRRREEWLEENERHMKHLNEQQRENFIKAHCNLTWQLFAPMLGVNLGRLGKLKRADAVLDDGSTMPLADFIELGPSDQQPHLIDPPDTDRNVAAKQNDALAAAITRAIEAAGKAGGLVNVGGAK